jgi:hypothetical protein
MSDVEKYWEAIRNLCNPKPPAWHELEPVKQMMIVQSINLLLEAIG